MTNASKLTLATIVIIATASAALPAAAQQLRPPQGQPPQATPQPQPSQKIAPPKPYTAVPVTLAKPYVDAGFEAFRKQLGAIAARKDRGALARLVANDFFWMGEQGDKANKKKPGIDNLAAAIRLDGKDAPGWQALAEIANEATLETIPDRKGVMCAPASPTYDESAAEQLAKATGTEPSDWGYLEKAGVEVRSAAQANAPVIERLGMHLVRVLPEQPATNGAANGAAQQQPSFMRVVTPSGKTGFVPEDAIAPLGTDQICYRNDAGAWKVVGYAGE
jgi:hypothetical protein